MWSKVSTEDQLREVKVEQKKNIYSLMITNKSSSSSFIYLFIYLLLLLYI